MNTRVVFLEPEQWYLLDSFCDREGIPRLDPAWARVVAAIDLDSTQIVGIMTLQLVAHAEPIWISQAYQGNGLWREMADTLNGYLQEMANQGALKGIYTQPTSEETRAICRKMGFYEAENPLFIKEYQPQLGGE